ncbi:MAG: hypothetical protein HPY66_1633 [Firmicutes bacterium]|nr:hypothetical protein [Bacillota bacterium]
MKLLVLATDYPKPDGYVASYFIHTRNKMYYENEIEVSVINFKATKDYIIDGINVYSLKNYKRKRIYENFDILISHAPNVRNHYIFLKKYHKRFKNIIFFFHGHEVLQSSKVYPKPYFYSKKGSQLWHIINDLYDRFKLMIWRKYFVKLAYKSQFVFVSEWMHNMFIKFVRIDPDLIKKRTHIIYNCIGKIFEIEKYDKNSQKEFDFITIRNILDKSKYGIDIVTRIAEMNPRFTFVVVGKGNFFKYNNKPKNLIFIDRHLTHEEIIEYLNRSKCALMPTRADAQGVMACEIATFGIPIITSNIAVCREVFDGFENVQYIDNESVEINIEPLFKKRKESKHKNTKYFAENTIGKELELFHKILDNSNTKK